jgi:MoxR-like ATPase
MEDGLMSAAGKDGSLTERLYVGDGKQHYPRLSNGWEEEEPYVASADLVEAVNVALYLRRPLLLEGDPGCGKTRLAYAVAYELGLPFKPCYIQSTSRARDLLYSFDAVKRLYDIQEHRSLGDTGEPLPREEYVRLGRLGEAIQAASEGIPSVVLIDEVDKADIDFPNDLLLVLDRLQFEIEEVNGYTVDAFRGKRMGTVEERARLPLIIITSNREKELPKPFLRRSLYYYIEFPNKQTLSNIIETHMEKKLTPLFQEALRLFWDLRAFEGFQWRKKPSTSELLDWVQILDRDEKLGRINLDTFKTLPLCDLPHLETLIKNQNDRDALRNAGV